MLETGVLLASWVGAALATIVLTVVVARHLGPHEFGLFANLLGVSQAFGLVVDLGLATWLLRDLAAAEHAPRPAADADADPGPRDASPPNLVGSGVTLSLVLGAVLLVASVVVARGAGTSWPIVVVLAALVANTTTIAVATLLETTFRARRQVGAVARAITVEKLVLVVGVVVAVSLDAGLGWIAVGYVTSGLVRLLVDVVALRRAGAWDVRIASPRTVLTTVRRALPFTFSLTAVVVLERLDVVIIALVSTVAAGYYAIGYRVVVLLLLLPVAASSALYPHFARDGVQRRRVWRVAGLLVLLTAVGSTIGIVLAPDVVPAAFGERFADAVPVVQVMLVGAPIMACGNALLASLHSSGRERQVARWTMASMAPGMGAFVLGLLVGGAVGAAWGYVGRSLCFAIAMAVLATRASTPERPPALQQAVVRP